MNKRKPFLKLLLIISLLFAVLLACDKPDEPIGDFSSAGTMYDADSNLYNTIKIGSQVWTVENLKTTTYNNGTEIPHVTSDTLWRFLSSGAYCNYDNQDSNAATYGRLYNWHAVNTGKLAPAGWRVATDEDWTALENFLVTNGYNYDGTNDVGKIAKFLASKTGWTLSEKTGTPGSYPEGNNSTGFSAFPGGNRNNNGNFINMGNNGYWWSATEGSTYTACYRSLYYSDGSLYRSFYTKECGFSVRLVRD
jgi:uncharacterized protein (TIGR02145 family)